MTKTTIYNERQMDVIMSDMANKFREYGSLSVDYGKPFKDSTKQQFGFIFGALIDSVIEFYKSRGEVWGVDEVKENFYQACAYLDERLKKQVTRFNGEKYEVPKRLSEMDCETTSVFIDKCIYLIDHAKCFEGLYLHPSIRYTWIRHITQDDIDGLRFVDFPRHDKEYLQYLRGQACLWCGCNQNVDAHHMRINGAAGIGIKPTDANCVSLCRKCHIRFHTKGIESFLQDCEWLTKYVDFATFLRLCYSRWKFRRG